MESSCVFPYYSDLLNWVHTLKIYRPYSFTWQSIHTSVFVIHCQNKIFLAEYCCLARFSNLVQQKFHIIEMQHFHTRAVMLSWQDIPGILHSSSHCSASQGFPKAFHLYKSHWFYPHQKSTYQLKVMQHLFSTLLPCYFPYFCFALDRNLSS